MTICNFFLQGRCRYGEKCWNEHPRGGNRGGGGGGGGGGYNNRSSTQQQSRGGGGFGNRVWVNPDQQKGSYIKASSFSSHGGDDWGRGGQGGSDWGRGGGGNDWGRGGGGGGGGGRGRDNVKSYEFGFSSQNRFSALDTPSTFDKGGGRRGGGGGKPGGDEEDDKQLEIIQRDMEVWESSGQWCLSCYSNSLAPLSGFTDVSPEELRLEYYSTRASGDLQGYVNGVNQLLNQWRNRISELKVMNPATRSALLAELNNPAPQASSSGFGTMTATGFGSTTSGFGSKGFGSVAPVQASSFSFAATSGGFGASSSSSAGFGSSAAAPTQPPSGFGSTSASSASTFSFTAAATNKPAATSGFGSASGFSFSSSANTGRGFGSGFGTDTPAAGGISSTFGQKSTGFGAPAAPAAAAAAAAGSAGEALDSLFSPESKLTPEELNQFKAKRFTLGQIPLKPPPANMLII